MPRLAVDGSKTKLIELLLLTHRIIFFMYNLVWPENKKPNFTIDKAEWAGLDPSASCVKTGILIFFLIGKFEILYFG